MSTLSDFFESLTSPGARADEADERLAAVSSRSSAPLRSSPTVSTVAEVAEHADTGEPILVPVVRCALESESEPPMDAVFQYVAAVCERLEGVYADDHVRQFDVRFAFGPDRFLRSRACRRVTVPPELASTLANPDYGARDLRADVEEADDGDSVTPPVAWGECVSYAGDDGTAAAVSTGGAY